MCNKQFLEVIIYTNSLMSWVGEYTKNIYESSFTFSRKVRLGAS